MQNSTKINYRTAVNYKRAANHLNQLLRMSATKVQDTTLINSECQPLKCKIVIGGVPTHMGVVTDRKVLQHPAMEHLHLSQI